MTTTPNLLLGYQRRYLRGLAHDLQPVVRVGKGGLTESVIAAVEEALEAHELIKVRLAGDRAHRQSVSDNLVEALQCEKVSAVGKVVVFYRPTAETDRKKIRLPQRSSAAAETA